QFFRSDERVLNPAPAQFFIQLLDALFTPQLEAGVGETPVRSNELLGPLEGAELLDFAARDEKGGLNEISGGPGEARRDSLRVHLGAEFGGPFGAFGVE